MRILVLTLAMIFASLPVFAANGVASSDDRISFCVVSAGEQGIYADCDGYRVLDQTSFYGNETWDYFKTLSLMLKTLIKAGYQVQSTTNNGRTIYLARFQ